MAARSRGGSSFFFAAAAAVPGLSPAGWLAAQHSEKARKLAQAKRCLSLSISFSLSRMDGRTDRGAETMSSSSSARFFPFLSLSLLLSRLLACYLLLFLLLLLLRLLFLPLSQWRYRRLLTSRGVLDPPLARCSAPRIYYVLLLQLASIMRKKTLLPARGRSL